MNDLLTKLIIGGLLGFCGQAIRAFLGLKKLWIQSNNEIQDFDILDQKTIFFENFSPMKLTLSLLIGFVAGLLASITIDGELLEQSSTQGDGLDAIYGLVLAGYGGTSFIEKAFGNFLD